MTPPTFPLARLQERSSQLAGRALGMVLNAMARARDGWRVLRNSERYPPARPSWLSEPGTGEVGRRGVIREVTEYVRRTIVSDPGVALANEPPGAAAVRPAHDAEGAIAQPVVESGPSPRVRHVTTTVEQRLLQLHANFDFASAADPIAAVHDLRVASRRLRAFFDTFGPQLPAKTVARGRKRLRRVTRAVAELREWDVNAVQLGERTEMVDNDAERAALEYLLDRIDGRRARLRKRARAQLARIDLDGIDRVLRAGLDQLAIRERAPGGSFEVMAWVALEAAINRVADACPPAHEQERPAELHALRIAVKRLRYALELVKPALGDGYAELHGRVKAVQELLGDHHDRVVLQTHVERRRARLEARRSGVLVQGMGPLVEHLTRERRRLFERFCALENELGRSGLRREVRAALGTHAARQPAQRA